MSADECDVCGLAACDLPDGVDPEFVFEFDDERNVTHCVTCDPRMAVGHGEGWD